MSYKAMNLLVFIDLYSSIFIAYSPSFILDIPFLEYKTLNLDLS